MVTPLKEDVKVLLIKPPQPAKATFHVMPPLGLGYIATAVKDRCEKVEILDCLCHRVSVKDLIARIGRSRPDIIGISMLSHDVPAVRLISDAVKKAAHEIVIVAGGAHPSSAPEHTLARLNNVDFAFKGEAEKGFPLLVDAVRERKTDDADILKGIPGLVYRSGGAICVNAQDFEEDLDRYGFPDWELIGVEKYFKTCQGVFYRSRKFASIFATRGCPFHCTFCAGHNVTGRRVRARSPAHIVAEMAYLVERYGIREFHFLDDNFTFDSHFVMALCDLIIEKGMDVTWTCPNGVRIDSLSRELLRKMKKAGCYALFVGIESGSQDVLDRVRKGLVIDEVVERVRMIKNEGYFLTAFFILGLPGETVEDMEKTIDLACSLPIDVADFSNFLPVPGSASVHESIGEADGGKIDFNRISSPAYVTNDAKTTEQKRKQSRMIRKAYLRFYSRPKTLLSLIARIRSLYQVYYLLKRVYQYVVRSGE